MLSALNMCVGVTRIAAMLVAGGMILFYLKPQEKTPKCDSCAYLALKQKDYNGKIRYRCSSTEMSLRMISGNPPEYCYMYKERSSHDSNLDT